MKPPNLMAFRSLPDAEVDDHRRPPTPSFLSFTGSSSTARLHRQYDSLGRLIAFSVVSFSTDATDASTRSKLKRY